ncbi:MAG: helix-turn-helix domain-containing protein [Actinobacteria bacterium]|nr:helix-turn-helix domain-containing protein [Actinomycetota bacterium]MCA1721292.1 helix-turn-helix domain-containing protein [Actinomycetota bacterium]
MDDERYVDLAEAAAHLGVSPTALAQLLDRGALPWKASADGRSRIVLLSDLEAHRDERFAFRQQLTQQARDQRNPAYGPESTTADVTIFG